MKARTRLRRGSGIAGLFLAPSVVALLAGGKAAVITSHGLKVASGDLARTHHWHRDPRQTCPGRSKGRLAVDSETGEASTVNDNVPSAGPDLAQAAGAAATDTRDLTPKGYGLNEIPGVKDVANAVSPNQRVYAGPSTEAKRALADIAETATRFEQHDQGVPTALNGAPLESIVRVQQNQLMTATHDLLKDAWVQHYYGDTNPGGVKIAAGMGVGAATQGDRLSFADFKNAVYDAGVNGDQHSIPEVQQAAQMLRSRVLDQALLVLLGEAA